MNDTTKIAAEACCAHRNVIYERVNHEGGTCSDLWKCADCGHKFIPESWHKAAIEKARPLIEAEHTGRMLTNESRAAHASENQTKWRHCPTCGSLVPRDVVSAAQSSEPWWYEITADGDWIIGSGSRGFALVNDESQAQIIVDRHNSRATHISNQLADFQVGCEKAYQKGRKDREREIYGLKDKPAHASEHRAGAWPYCNCEICKPRADELIDEIVGDLVRETNIFPNQVERAKQLIRERLSVKKKVMNCGLKKVEK